MEEFKPNSHKSKDDADDRKKLDKVVKGEVITKKKSSSKKLAETLALNSIGRK